MDRRTCRDAEMAEGAHPSAGYVGALAAQRRRGQILGHGASEVREGGMHYEEKSVEGWLWHRRVPHGGWEKASGERMIGRLRGALEAIAETTDCPERRKTDVVWLRGALLTARATALSALGR
jgi:hypothetical protein